MRLKSVDYYRWHTAVIGVMKEARSTGKPWSDADVTCAILAAWAPFTEALRGLCWVKTSVWLFAEPSEIVRDPWFADDLDEAVETVVKGMTGDMGYRWPV